MHLSGDTSLRNGLISQVCTKAPDDIKEQFADITKKKREEKERAQAKRKRMGELMRSNSWGGSPSKQSKLEIKTRSSLKDETVDDAWGKAFFGLDISPNKVDHALFKEAIEATKQAKIKFVLCIYVDILLCSYICKYIYSRQVQRTQSTKIIRTNP